MPILKPKDFTAAQKTLCYPLQRVSPSSTQIFSHQNSFDSPPERWRINVHPSSLPPTLSSTSPPHLAIHFWFHQAAQHKRTQADQPYTNFLLSLSLPECVAWTAVWLDKALQRKALTLWWDQDRSWGLNILGHACQQEPATRWFRDLSQALLLADNSLLSESRTIVHPLNDQWYQRWQWERPIILDQWNNYLDQLIPQRR